jgi:hypothetical protein
MNLKELGPWCIELLSPIEVEKLCEDPILAFVTDELKLAVPTVVETV